MLRIHQGWRAYCPNCKCDIEMAWDEVRFRCPKCYIPYWSLTNIREIVIDLPSVEES